MDSEDVTNPYAIAVQGTNVYVADNDISSVIKMGINGNSKVNLIQYEVDTPSGIAADDSTVYIMNQEYGAISTMNLVEHVFV